MSDETPGAGQGALPPREAPNSAPSPTTTTTTTPMRFAQVSGGQYVLTSQSPGMPALAQISSNSSLYASSSLAGNVTRIISISPSRPGQTSPLRPSLANQSIVNVLTKSRSNSNIRLQLFPTTTTTADGAAARPPGVKRSYPFPGAGSASGATTPPSASPTKDSFSNKLQRIMNHKLVRSKLVKEKYNEHLLEFFYMETGGNILDFYLYAKRPRSREYLAYLNDHDIDVVPGKTENEVPVPIKVEDPISATSMASLPGNSNVKTLPTPKTPTSNNNKPLNTPSSTSNQEQIVEKAKQEAYVLQRITELQKEGLWSEKRLPKVQEMQRTKAHWDYLLEEMVWLAADFAQERKWKKAAAKKCARMVQKYFQDKALAVQRAEKAQEQHLRRIASYCAKEIKNFWNNVEKLVEFKQNTILEEKRKKALDQQLSFIVDQTEKYSQLLAEGMNKTVPSSTVSSRSSRVHSDDEFEPLQSDEDDEETIAQEEASAATNKEEIAELQRESQLELDDLLEDDLLRNYLLNRDSIRMSESEDSDDDSKKKPVKKIESSEESEEEDSEEESEDETIGETKEEDELKMLVDDEKGERNKTDQKDDLINDAAAIAESIQPKGNTLSSTSVSTKVPFLLKFPLREYQHIGLDWLVTMFERKLNGILADEMGLGKTIQTIALLAHLACEKENWGPHLIVVPTSVMLNWEMECKKWCPAFKILTYYGSQKERKIKRTGWTKPNTFHICITSYKLVIQDHQSFRRKKWKYLILDEAQNIKNFKSQRWQLLLNFQSQQRLLLTGTPLQNNLMELWSLMHFLMPNVFQSHREFKEWFSNPVTGMIEGNSEYNESIIKRLHKVLRPFLLRRLKCEVEKQMPKKYEHVVMCRLSKRQRFLYEDYMSRAKTRETLAGGNLLSVINVLMQLRKVCNHPNLFEVRPTISPFQCEGIRLHIPSMVYAALDYDVWKHVSLYSMNLMILMLEMHLTAYTCYRMRKSRAPSRFLEASETEVPPAMPFNKINMRVVKLNTPIEPKKEVLTAMPMQLQAKVLTTGSTTQNLKIKVPPQYLVKSIPVVNVSQSNQVSMTSVLKPAEKISAQLVQTATGKHLLLTAPSITGNIPSPSTGQKYTFLSKPSTNHLTKAIVKFQLTAVTTATVPTVTTTTSKTPKTVGAKYLEQLYGSKTNNLLDVRWKQEEKLSENGDCPEVQTQKERQEMMARINYKRCSALPLYGRDFQDSVKIFVPNSKDSWQAGRINCLNTLYFARLNSNTETLRAMLKTPEERIAEVKEVSDRFIFYVPAVRAAEPDLQVWHPPPSRYWGEKNNKILLKRLFNKPATPLHHIASAMVTQFPDPRLIQYDCGKLQTLDKLLRKLKCGSHRVLIFTQMTKMLDVLEAFLNFHGHIYLRLDGTTKVDQRQVLMERFNGDKRIFAFILSTRSGGVGVNLTGADTVIFYDSDWNPTMDAQAQDRCHRIGQTRDVHIYRLISERTIEENILKKANQKRLLGDLAIEGGNFTTAFFKSSTIQDLFEIDHNEESASVRISLVENHREKENPEEKSAVSTLEQALAACEDDQDVLAARTAKAEAVADLAEFDETIPLEDQDKREEPELSKAEQEIDNVIKKLSPIERYAMRFIEETESAWSVEQLKAAEREIEEQKLEWERNRLAAMKEEEERRARELEEDSELLTFSREDATNQIWVSDNTTEQMPMWCPPTPPEQNTDVYIDQTMSFLYDLNVMSETQLPPVYIKKETVKRSRIEAGLSESRRALKIARKEEHCIPSSALMGGSTTTNAPKSIFHSMAILKMRRDLKMQKVRGMVRLPVVPVPGKIPVNKIPEQHLAHEWSIHEDMALLKVIQNFQGLPLNLFVLNPAHVVNWDFVADYVNTVAISYRSPKLCKLRYETILLSREEGKQAFDGSLKKKKKSLVSGMATPKSPVGRGMRTCQLFAQDNNATFSQIMVERYDSLKSIANKRPITTRTLVNTPLVNKGKLATFNECMSGIDMDHPILPVEVAQRRAERLQREKLQLLKQPVTAQVSTTTSTTTTVTVVAPTGQQQQVVMAQPPVVVTTVTAPTVPTTPPTIRTQRIIASPIQSPTVVSVSGLNQAQLQAATQRFIAGNSPGQQVKAALVGAAAQGKPFTPAQLQVIRHAALKQQQLRLHSATGTLPAQSVKTSTVTIGGQQAVVQFTQAQNSRSFVRQGPLTVNAKGGITRTVTESEMAQLLKKQQLQQQQKLSLSSPGGAQVPSLSQQVFAHALQQAGTSGQSVATLVKAVSTAGGTQTVTIPVSGMALAAAQAQGKNIAPMKTPPQFRSMQLQQQLLAQKKLGQKLSIAQVKNNLSTQLIVGSKPLSTAMTVQQIHQVIRSPMSVSPGQVVLAKGQRVITNTAPGHKHATIQVVAASPQSLNLRPQSGATSALAGALSGVKVQSTTAQQAAILSQVTAALSQQQQNVRQGSPVRLPAPVVAVTVHSPAQPAPTTQAPSTQFPKKQ